MKEMAKITFCDECRDFVGYNIEEEYKEVFVRGKNIKYKNKIAYCEDCKNEIYVGEINDYNIDSLHAAIRMTENLITIGEINNILEKYKIGKKPLSLLLGWAEVTIIRYLKGDLPSKEYSDLLKTILDDPREMSTILEKNKLNITDIAYRRCRAAIDEILNNEICVAMLNDNTIDLIAKYLIIKCEEITPLALQKLLYYCQGFYKAFKGENLFINDCEAWIHGPVYRGIHYKYKDFGYRSIAIEDNEIELLNQPEIDIIDSVIKYFGCYSGKILENMTHYEEPWKQSRLGLDDSQNSDKIIEKKLIEGYFTHIIEEYEIESPEEISKYSFDLFKNVI